MTIRDHHEAVMSSAFKQKRPERDCAWCRLAVYETGKNFACTLNLPQDAMKCPEYRDSRLPSLLPEYRRVGE